MSEEYTGRVGKTRWQRGWRRVQRVDMIDDKNDAAGQLAKNTQF